MSMYVRVCIMALFSVLRNVYFPPPTQIPSAELLIQVKFKFKPKQDLDLKNSDKTLYKYYGNCGNLC